MTTDQIGAAVLRAFAVVGVATAFFPALAKSRSSLGVTFLIALVACAILWSH